MIAIRELDRNDNDLVSAHDHRPRRLPPGRSSGGRQRYRTCRPGLRNHEMLRDALLDRALWRPGGFGEDGEDRNEEDRGTEENGEKPGGWAHDGSLRERRYLRIHPKFRGAITKRESFGVPN